MSRYLTFSSYETSIEEFNVSRTQNIVTMTISFTVPFMITIGALGYDLIEDNTISIRCDATGTCGGTRNPTVTFALVGLALLLMIGYVCNPAHDKMWSNRQIRIYSYYNRSNIYSFIFMVA